MSLIFFFLQYGSYSISKWYYVGSILSKKPKRKGLIRGIFSVAVDRCFFAQLNARQCWQVPVMNSFLTVN